jgi:hypothetical protein
MEGMVTVYRLLDGVMITSQVLPAAYTNRRINPTAELLTKIKYLDGTTNRLRNISKMTID